MLVSWGGEREALQPTEISIFNTLLACMNLEWFRYRSTEVQLFELLFFFHIYNEKFHFLTMNCLLNTRMTFWRTFWQLESCSTE